MGVTALLHVRCGMRGAVCCGSLRVTRKGGQGGGQGSEREWGVHGRGIFFIVRGELVGPEYRCEGAEGSGLGQKLLRGHLRDRPSITKGIHQQSRFRHAPTRKGCSKMTAITTPGRAWADSID